LFIINGQGFLHFGSTAAMPDFSISTYGTYEYNSPLFGTGIEPRTYAMIVGFEIKSYHKKILSISNIIYVPFFYRYILNPWIIVIGANKRDF